MKYKRSLIGLVMVFLVGLFAGQASANNIAVTNVVFYDLKTSSSNAWVQFDLSWDNSWRVSGSLTNWDAAWVFIKYADAGGTNHHAYLSTSASKHTAASDSTIEVGLTSSTTGMGVFVYRKLDGTGNNNFTGMRLCWDYSGTGLDLQKDSTQQVSVHAIEMVYIPEGPFYLGSSGDEAGRLYEGNVQTPFHVTNIGPITCANSNGCLWGSSSGTGDNGMGGAGTISNAFPNGYSAFYCMKYEISQGQYADFLNNILNAHAQNHDYPPTANHHTIAQNTQPYSASVPDRACNYLSWKDGAAYADWSGLRPMTELEFEKACRGPLPGVAGEFVWGNTNLNSADYVISNGGQPDSTIDFPTPGDGNGIYKDNNNDASVGDGPIRCGIFAASTNSPTRAEAGATYWGVMDMSGNIWERSITIGKETGRAFMGTHGDGELDSSGDRTNGDWPGTDAVGAGFRGGGWNATAGQLCTSDRARAASTSTGQDNDGGWRVVRSAPAP